MTDTPTVRQMQSDELGHWVRLRSALWPDCGPEDNAADIAAYRSGGPIKAIFLAFDEDEHAIGFAEISLRSVVDSCPPGPTPYLEGWYVEPDWQGQGVGAELIHAVIGWAVKGGYKWLGSDAEIENTGSQSAHEALGFEETGRVVNFRMRLDP